MAQFEIAYNLTNKAEGGYVNNPKDRGGETWAGIARKKNPSWKGWIIIDTLKGQRSFPSNLEGNVQLKKLQVQFYKENYWDRNKLDAFKNQAIADKMYDIGVLMGTAVAAKMLQRSLNVTNNNGTYYKDMPEDGTVGKITIGAVNSHPRPEVIFKCLNVFEGDRLIKLAERNQTQETFINGWFMNRIASIITEDRSKFIA
jgi:lysozyme family protein